MIGILQGADSCRLDSRRPTGKGTFELKRYPSLAAGLHPFFRTRFQKETPRKNRPVKTGSSATLEPIRGAQNASRIPALLLVNDCRTDRLGNSTAV